MNKEITSQIKKTGLIASAYGGLFGFISDILNPIAPFSSYLFYISLFLIVVILLIIFFKPSLQEKISPLLIISICLFIVSGSLFALQENTNTNSKEYGVLANQIPALKTLQSSLGVIEEDVELIIKSSENLDQTTARSDEVVKKVEINTKKNIETTKEVAEVVE